MGKKCRCRIRYGQTWQDGEGSWHKEDGRIVRCPTHQAAPQLREALKSIIATQHDFEEHSAIGKCAAMWQMAEQALQQSEEAP